MYLDHYQLKTKPFQITADPKFLWLGEKHKEALATLRYGILDNRGFLLLTGEVGTGKTLLINRLISMLDMDTAVATLPDPDLTSMDFYNILADGFKMNRTFDSKGAFLLHLRDFLHKSYADQKQVLLIIDESQRLNHRLMEDIRVLSNIELQDRKLINIFFVGQQEFNTILTAPQNRALAQRITVRYHITPLEKKEVGEYVQHRLSVAGTTQKIFNASAIDGIYQFSGGIPRLINILCDHALLTGYARNAKTIDARIIEECAQELRIPIKSSVKGMVATMNTIESKTIGNAASRQSGGHVTPPGPADMAEITDTPASPKDEEGETNATARSPLWKIFYSCIVIALVLLGGYAITQITSKERPKYDAEDLTPQQYRSTLEKEQALLSQSMENMTAAGGAGAEKPSSSAANGVAATPAKSNVAESSVGQTAKESQAPKVKVKENPTSGVGEIEPLPLMDETIMVHFTINSNEIEDGSYAVLDRIANYLVRQPDKVVHVRGYTDASGSAGYNESVSRFRASVVKSYLVGKGAPPENIEIFAMGAENPVASNETAEGRRLNRRVEIDFQTGNQTTN
ncbi:AAA family ATPase [Desulfatitalea tepidiphila]|uniref:AAA family ATPase n=1 Tax=Desulfatitalea tepidiphila TaxID=1185843 RepID=UPI0006B48CF6|nr:AAA family ATPase [Desulfatitalea tepidiphila]